MTTYIALLRGINVGGHKKVPMAALRELLMTAGLKQVKTYIQSGNVIFQSFENPKELEVTIQKGILDYFGFEVSVIVKTPEELQTIIDDCPLPQEKRQHAFFVIFNKIPNVPLVQNVPVLKDKNETVIIKKDALYFYCSAGYSQTKFNMNTYERKLKVIGTSRNYNTMLKLIALAHL